MSTNLYTKSAQSSWPVKAPLEFFTFPGGEHSIRPTGQMPQDVTLAVAVGGSNADDLIKAGIAARYARSHSIPTALLLPYLPAARSDHDDVMGVEVYAGIVNSFGFDQVVAIDPHSAYSAKAFDNLTVVDHTPMVTSAVGSWGEVVGIIAADKSGSAHARSIADVLGVSMYQALKHRDPATGKLTGFSCDPLPGDGKLLVVDDICDGGGTFLGLAQVAGVPKARLGLWVTHGIFSGGAVTKLQDAFDFIATTDDLPTDHTGVHVVSALSTMFNAVRIESGDRETFGYGARRWDITRAKRIVADGRAAHSYPVSDLTPGLMTVAFDPDHADQLPDECLDEPIIMAQFTPGRHMVIDGYHRILKASKQGRQSLDAYTLTYDESMSLEQEDMR